MRRYVTMVVGLVLGAAVCAAGHAAQAGTPPQHALPFNNARSQADEQQVQPAGYYQAAHAGGCQSCQTGPAPVMNDMDGADMDGSYMDGSYMGDSCGCDDGSCGYGSCGTGYDWWPGDDMLFGGGYGLCGRLHLGADYLYVRSNVSDGYAYLTRTVNTGTGEATDEIHDLDFNHESSYRIFGGYELGGCGEQLRFTFTRFNSYANITVPSIDSQTTTNYVPYLGAVPPDGGYVLEMADVDFKTYDLELAKTIPLGGSAACDCGCSDPCDGSCGCAPSCPTWDITWSGGIRFADTDWRRTFTAVDDTEAIVEHASTVMNFEGGGPRIGLEGRRYLGCAGIFSIFLRGDLSLLMGNIDLRTEVADLEAETTETQIVHTRNVIPVYELEGGLTAQLSCHTRLSAGYLFSAWQDLGIRDQTCFTDAQGSGLTLTAYDDSNIMAFDSMFIRLEADF